MMPIRSYKYGINTVIAMFGALISTAAVIAIVAKLFSGNDVPYGILVAFCLFASAAYFFIAILYAALRQKNRLEVFQSHIHVPYFLAPWSFYRIELTELYDAQRKPSHIVIILKDKTEYSLWSINIKKSDISSLFEHLKTHRPS